MYVRFEPKRRASYHAVFDRNYEPFISLLPFKSPNKSFSKYCFCLLLWIFLRVNHLLPCWLLFLMKLDWLGSCKPGGLPISSQNTLLHCITCSTLALKDQPFTFSRHGRGHVKILKRCYPRNFAPVHLGWCYVSSI